MTGKNWAWARAVGSLFVVGILGGGACGTPTRNLGGSPSAGGDAGAGDSPGHAGPSAGNSGSSGGPEVAGSAGENEWGGASSNAGGGGMPQGGIGNPTGSLPGVACTANGDCGSGQCADGVCCLTRCDGACVACNLPSAPGQCVPVSAGTPSPTGHTACDKQATSTCGSDGMCDGAGACRKYESGTDCAGGSCDATTNKSVTGASCDGKGTCKQATAVPCAPFKCSGASCATKCAGNSDCVGAPCVSGSCGTVADGSKCTADAQCTNAHCVDGLCCNSACTGSCQACDVATHEGVCTTLASNATPHGTRAACSNATCSSSCDGTSSACTFKVNAPCGTCKACTAAGACQPVTANTVDAACQGTVCSSGACDGSGACKAAAAGASCGGAYSCSESTPTFGQYNNVDHHPLVCNGTLGSCSKAGANEGCGNYVCANGTDCKVSCTVDMDCLDQNYCKAGICTPWVGMGGTCSKATQCTSRVCFNGQCTTCYDSKDCPKGNECNAAGQCVTGFDSFDSCVYQGQCQTYARAPFCNANGGCDCYGSPACPAGSVCTGPADTGGKCAPPKDFPCKADAECAVSGTEPSTCRNGVCISLVCADNGQCAGIGICCSYAPHSCYASCS